MILFVFEGERREPTIFRTMELLYFQNSDSIICSYGNNIYNLFIEMSESDFQMDIASILHEKWKGTEQDPFGNSRISSDFSETFLFFDYDCHHQDKKQLRTSSELNSQVKQMLDFFTDETGNGKLYLNYPMVESIRYTQKLPDPLFYMYEIAIGEISMFKKTAADFSFYKNLDELCFRITKGKVLKHPDYETLETVKQNWIFLVEQNIRKAHFICSGLNTYPKEKDEIKQSVVFQNELSKYINHHHAVSILNSFPLFLFEYFTGL